MIYRFDALPPNTCYRIEKVPFMSQTISAAEEAIFPLYEYQLESSAPSTWLFATNTVLLQMQ
jgi:hypothetical protein